MKILKLLNSKDLSIIIISLLLNFSSIAEEKPVDIWNLDKKETQNISEENLSVEKNEETSQSSIYKMQSDKKKESIKQDKELTSKTIKIAGSLKRLNKKGSTLSNLSGPPKLNNITATFICNFLQYQLILSPNLFLFLVKFHVLN